MKHAAAWFDAVFLINLARRPDRLQEATAELSKLGLPLSWVMNVHRFDAYGDLLDHTGKVNGNLGCTNSHRGVLELIAFHHYERALVLEDDFMLRPSLAEAHEHILHAVTEELPREWRMLYLGGSYGENPKRRHSEHLIETNAVMTTSSYCLGWQQARHMAPHIHGIGPIDSLFARFNREPGCFMTCPRLFVQRPSWSDLTERMAENVTSMEDTSHEDMLLQGTWITEWPSGGMPGKYSGPIRRREIAAAQDMNGTDVIVDGKLYKVAGLQLPDHLPPWFKGEPCVYTLRLP